MHASYKSTPPVKDPIAKRLPSGFHDNAVTEYKFSICFTQLFETKGVKHE